MLEEYLLFSLALRGGSTRLRFAGGSFGPYSESSVLDDESLDDWAASVYNETMDRERTSTDVAIAHDILRARFNRNIDK